MCDAPKRFSKVETVTGQLVYVYFLIPVIEGISCKLVRKEVITAK